MVMVFYPAKEISMCGGKKLSGPLSDRIRILTFDFPLFSYRF